MSNKPNHRRGHGRIQDNGPTWEGGPPSSGCNSTHVARSRRKWKRHKNRAERRTDGPASKYAYGIRGEEALPKFPDQEIDMAKKTGPTGEFPQGKMHEEDEGELGISIGHTAEGKIVIDMGKPVAWLGMDPEEARAFAEGLMKHAAEAEKMQG